MVGGGGVQLAASKMAPNEANRPAASAQSERRQSFRHEHLLARPQPRAVDTATKRRRFMWQTSQMQVCYEGWVG